MTNEHFPPLPSTLTNGFTDDMVYLGTGKDVPTIRRNYFGYSDTDVEWSSKWEGSDDLFNYAIKFGTPEWNRWAEDMFDIPKIDDDYVWIGENPKGNIGVTRFRGGVTYLNTRSEWNYDRFDELIGDVTSHYLIHKDDPQFKKAQQYFHNLSMVNKAPVIDSDPVLEELNNSHDKLVKEYQTAKEELHEAKENGWKIKHHSQNTSYLIDRGVEISIVRGVVSFYNNDFYGPWSDFTIIKEEPVPPFSITTDEGTFKPEYNEGYWKFGCAKINHSYIKGIVNLYNDEDGNAGEYKGITSVTLGKGTFTMDQIKELHQYHTNK